MLGYFSVFFYVFYCSLTFISSDFRSFDGFATQADYLRNTMDLAEAVGDMNKLEYTTYYMAGYDSPFKWWDRTNESWIRAKINTKPVPNKEQ